MAMAMATRAKGTADGNGGTGGSGGGRQPRQAPKAKAAPAPTAPAPTEPEVPAKPPILEGVPPDAPARTLREWRDEAIMSQREFALALGANPASVALWETGSHRPRPATIRRLAERLGIRPQQIAVAKLPPPTTRGKRD